MPLCAGCWAKSPMDIYEPNSQNSSNTSKATKSGGYIPRPPKPVTYSLQRSFSTEAWQGLGATFLEQASASTAWPGSYRKFLEVRSSLYYPYGIKSMMILYIPRNPCLRNPCIRKCGFNHVLGVLSCLVVGISYTAKVASMILWRRLMIHVYNCSIAQVITVGMRPHICC